MTEQPLTIAVLGAGNIGGTLGKKWQAAGYQVRFGMRDPGGKHAQALRVEFGDQVTIGTIGDALKGGPEVVLVALPGAVVDLIAQEYAADDDPQAWLGYWEEQNQP